MTTFDAILVGLIQGLTEFIPVSSSGHLAVAKFFVPIRDLDLNYIVLLHFGTVLAIFAALWKDIWILIRDFCKGEKYALNFALLILISMVPAAIVGFTLDDVLERIFCEKGLMIGRIPLEPYRLIGLAFIACAYWVLTPANNILKARNQLSPEEKEEAEKDLKGLDQMTWKDALWIGLAQAVAVIPGLSRSGSTIYAGLLCKLKSDAAARFSFLMSIPVILGAALKDVVSPEFRSQVAVSWHNGDGTAIVQIIGILVAAVSGYVAIKLLLRMVNRYNFRPFVIYLWIIGLVCIAS
ncbi:undecaprenyl-diphosphate phosphatase [bacterium]|nr:undecaprenyl-diphosphate phosphatase [bacterium]